MRKVLNHSLITHKLTHMRKKETSMKEFRENLKQIASLMAYEVTKDLPMKQTLITTPLQTCEMPTLEKEVVLVPILRAGLGMVEGFQNLLSDAKIAHIGLYRDEQTLQPHTYLEKYPKGLNDAIVIVLDPMLATGGSAVAAIHLLKKQGATNISFVGLVGANEGVSLMEEHHPDVCIYLASFDGSLNASGYIVPGLGDAGDRIFGTDD